MSVLIDATGEGQPALAHWGADLGDLSPAELGDLLADSVPAVPNAVLDQPLRRGLLPERALGYRGRPGLSGHRSGADFAPRLGLTSCEVSGDVVVLTSTDDSAGLSVRSELELTGSGVLRINHEVRNTGETPYQLAELAAILPIPDVATEVLDFTGRWSAERVPQRQRLGMGAWTRENRRGRTASDASFVTTVGTDGFGNRTGTLWSVHLAWSGDQATWSEAIPDGTRVIGAAELLAPGEVELLGGESYRTPDVYGAWSDRGLDGISERFHHLVRSHRNDGPRPVVLNTWEAVYFDHDLTRLRDLADIAARVGVERFVLDDGWFGGRRDDHSSLGDWTVSSDVWPDGLGPLVDHVRGLGMQFGLWFEPEMINVDSDLYRAHPDWLLGPHDRLPPEARYQQVLDVARPEAAEYLFDRIDSLVKEYGIDFIKWDHNRDLVHAMHEGRAGVHAQTLAAYRLFERLKEANPGLEIESCSSGGARVDLGILQHTDRFWTSDCNDALERQHIQRWTQFLIPPELLGTHVGPPEAHTTGRRHNLTFRAATAFFGHFGIEWDIASASEQDQAALVEIIAAYKRLRGVLHTGSTVNIDHPDPSATFSGVVAADRSSAVFCYAQLATTLAEKPSAARFAGLDPDRRYRVTPLTPAGEPAAGHRVPPPWLAAGSATMSGRTLQTVGLPLPVLHPEEALLLELVAV
ncbi:alpha-galactosidase [Nakamurella panacisegetis]|uniref:alpha-galactosidase n=1 Tax=Nakamurella panacisegetis TaxID=1090615 RepID=UPI0018D4B1D0|nr:alpha-galactosidase [Nakamurella panacisegetis]